MGLHIPVYFFKCACSACTFFFSAFILFRYGGVVTAFLLLEDREALLPPPLPEAKNDNETAVYSKTTGDGLKGNREGRRRWISEVRVFFCLLFSLFFSFFSLFFFFSSFLFLVPSFFCFVFLCFPLFYLFPSPLFPHVSPISPKQRNFASAVLAPLTRTYIRAH